MKCKCNHEMKLVLIKDRYEELLIMCPEFARFEITNYVKELEIKNKILSKVDGHIDKRVKDYVSQLESAYIYTKV